MKLIHLPLLLIPLLSGCASFKLPPISCDYWEHKDNYGPFQDHIVVEGFEKNPDGSASLISYTGTGGWMGFGPSDTLRGVKVNAATVAASQVLPK